MKQTKDDRRSRRSHQLLGDALQALMQEKRYAAITVQEILDRADVGRSTFYAHFYDKDDLLVHTIELMLERLSREVAQAGESLLFPSLPLFQHAGEYRELYAALKRANQIDMLIATFHRYLAQDVAARLARALPSAPSAPLPAVAATVAGSFLALLRWWLDVEPARSPEEIDNLFRALVLPGLRAIVAQPNARSGLSAPASPAAPPADRAQHTSAAASAPARGHSANAPGEP